MIRMLVHGVGRMARRVLSELPHHEVFEPLGLISRTRPADIAGIDWFASLAEVSAPADLMIDFTLPGGTRLAADWCALNNTAFLSGTTGLQAEDFEALKQAALKVPVLWAPNLSHGVALMTALVRQAATALDAGAQVTVSDVHHRHKVDAPSGTALALAGAVKEGRSAHLQSLADSGQTSGVDQDPVFSSVREGEVVGEHTVSFVLTDEVIEITHKALDRDVFARGALKAGAWLIRQPPGYYSTADWLGLR